MRVLFVFVDTNLKRILDLIRDFYHKAKNSLNQKWKFIIRL